MKSVGFAILFLGLANGYVPNDPSNGLANNGGGNPYNEGHDGGIGFFNSNGYPSFSRGYANGHFVHWRKITNWGMFPDNCYQGLGVTRKDMVKDPELVPEEPVCEAPYMSFVRPLKTNRMLVPDPTECPKKMLSPDKIDMLVATDFVQLCKVKLID